MDRASAAGRCRTSQNRAPAAGKSTNLPGLTDRLIDDDPRSERPVGKDRYTEVFVLPAGWHRRSTELLAATPCAICWTSWHWCYSTAWSCSIRRPCSQPVRPAFPPNRCGPDLPCRRRVCDVCSSYPGTRWRVLSSVDNVSPSLPRKPDLFIGKHGCYAYGYGYGYGYWLRK